MNEFRNRDYSCFPSPAYVVEEELVRRNLTIIQDVARRAGVEIIMAFKAFALWRLFPITRQYIPCSTASSLNEALLARNILGTKAHTYAPVYKAEEMDRIIQASSHITFNSVSQYRKYAEQCHRAGVSCGLRINPEHSDVETDLYNPCAPGSRLGITADQLTTLPDGIEGLHFHTLCESSSYDLEKTLATVEQRFGRLLDRVQWLNMGGGHLMTREDYDREHLIRLIIAFKKRHPGLNIIMEPGSAHMWRTGVLIAEIQDIVENHGIRTAILDVSFACHMPDCLEMPYQPAIIGATTTDRQTGEHIYRMGGNSCLSGDYVGSWQFDHELQPGERIVFEDMNHYTNVKTTMFNGISHPRVMLRHTDGLTETLREYSFDDYLSRMD